MNAPITPGFHWKNLVGLSDEELSRIDIAKVNLACAESLPGADKIKIPHCLRTLHRWADEVRVHTKKLLPRFQQDPASYNNSEAYFRVLTMTTVLIKNCGARYNEAKIPLDVPLDLDDTFIHGIIQGQGGTCASLPVVWAAVGRRLGYPIKLVSTRSRVAGHLFARWDGGGERFNIEVNNTGMGTTTDDEFRGEPYGLTPEMEAAGDYLKSKTPRQELAGSSPNAPTAGSIMATTAAPWKPGPGPPVSTATASSSKMR